jgi:acetylornithine/succinyldiaminopimelate/putrescine aminotransferase
MSETNPPLSQRKRQALERFHDHVSSGKVRFWRQFDMDLVRGQRQGPWFQDLDGEKPYLNLHCNGGVYNLGHRNPEVLRALENATR